MDESDRLYKELAYSLLLSSLVIALLNLVLLFDIGRQHRMEALHYAIYAVMAAFPIVVVGSSLSRYIAHRRGRTYFLVPRSEREKKIFRIRPGELLLANTEPHPLYFLRLAVGIGVLTGLFFFLSMGGTYLEPAQNSGWWWNLLITSGILSIVVYSTTTDPLPRHSYIESLEHTWALFFSFWWSVSAAAVLKAQVEMQYPHAFWEEFLGLPSVAMIMFAIILFVTSSMIWRLDSYLSSREPSPLGTISVTLMAAGIAALFPPLWFLFSPVVRNVFFMGTIILTLVYWMLLSVFLYYKGGMKFIFTTRRMIVVKDFLGTDVSEHLYDSIISVELIQGPFGRYFNYGDLSFVVRRGKKRVGFTVHGIRNPVLVKNMALAMKNRRKIKKKREKRIPERKYHLRAY